MLLHCGLLMNSEGEGAVTFTGVSRVSVNSSNPKATQRTLVKSSRFHTIQKRQKGKKSLVGQWRWVEEKGIKKSVEKTIIHQVC